MQIDIITICKYPSIDEFLQGTNKLAVIKSFFFHWITSEIY